MSWLDNLQKILTKKEAKFAMGGTRQMTSTDFHSDINREASPGPRSTSETNLIPNRVATPLPPAPQVSSNPPVQENDFEAMCDNLDVKDSTKPVPFSSDIKARNAAKSKVHLKYRLYECIKDWAQETTAHGFKNIKTNPSWISKIKWIILVIACLGYSCYGIVNSFVQFLSFGVIVNYQYQTDYPSVFPAVSICNLNAFDVTTDPSVGNKIIAYLQANHLNPTISLSGSEQAIQVVSEASEIIKASITSDTSLSAAQRANFSFLISTMLVSCFYNGDGCSPSDFKWFWSNDYGNCYTFNALTNSSGTQIDGKTMNKPGLTSGLSLELYVGAQGYQDFYTIYQGVKVIVHERGILPLVRYDGNYAASGSATTITVSRTNYSKLDWPYSNCRMDISNTLDSDSIYYKKTVSISQYYQRLCEEICMQYEFVIKICGCGDPSVPQTDTTTVLCNNATTLDCVKDVQDNYTSLGIHDTCSNYCPTECNSNSYAKSISTAQYPTSYYQGILKTQSNLIGKFSSSQQNQYNGGGGGGSTSNSSSSSQPSSTQISESVLSLSVYFEDLRYVYIQEVPAITVDTFIGILGGQFGLCLGASFLSLIEFIETCVLMVQITIEYYGFKLLTKKKKVLPKPGENQQPPALSQ